MIKSILIICLSFFWIIRSLKQLFCHTVSHFLFIIAVPSIPPILQISLNLIICVIPGPNCLHLFLSHGFHRFPQISSPCIPCPNQSVSSVSSVDFIISNNSCPTDFTDFVSWHAFVLLICVICVICGPYYLQLFLSQRFTASTDFVCMQPLVWLSG